MHTSWTGKLPAILTLLMLVMATVAVAQTKVDIMSFGAVGDSLTDDTRAIQNALSSGADTVYFSHGKYTISGSITPLPNQVLLGDGIGNSILYFTNGTYDGWDVSMWLQSGDFLQGLSIVRTQGENFLFAQNANAFTISMCDIRRADPSSDQGGLLTLWGNSRANIDQCIFTQAPEGLPIGNSCIVLGEADTVMISSSTLNATGYAISLLGNSTTYAEIRNCKMYQSQLGHGDILNVYFGTVVADSCSFTSTKFALVQNPSQGYINHTVVRNSTFTLLNGSLCHNESPTNQMVTVELYNCTVVQNQMCTYTGPIAFDLTNTNLTLQNISYRLLNYLPPQSDFLKTQFNSIVRIQNVTVYNAGLEISNAQSKVYADNVIIKNEGYPATSFDAYLLNIDSCGPGSYFRNCSFVDSNVVTPRTPTFMRFGSGVDPSFLFSNDVISTTRNLLNSIELHSLVSFDTCSFNTKALWLDPGASPRVAFNGGIISSAADSLFVGSGSVRMRHTVFHKRSWSPSVEVDYDDHPPVFTTKPPVYASYNSLYQYNAGVADQDSALFDEVVHYRLLSPRWLSIDSITGYVSGKPGISNLSDTLVIIQAYDLADSVAQQQYYLHITEHIVVNMKVFLQGPFSGGAMTTTLDTCGLIPRTSDSAYSAATYGYAASTVSSIPNASIVDWLLVELRSDTAGATKMAGRAGFLKSDGTVVDIDGASPLSFTGVSPGNYYVVVRHRNHLAIMSAVAVALSSTSALYDFTTAHTQAYGTNAMAALAGGAFGMIAGDVNQDGIVKYNLGANDRALVYVRIGSNSVNTTVSGYYPEDVNLDGVVKYNLSNNDRGIIYVNIGSGSVNATVSTKVPK